MEVTPSTEITPSPTPTENNVPVTLQTTAPSTATTATTATTIPEEPLPEYASSFKSDGASSKSSGFKPGSLREARSRRSTLTLASDDERPHTAKDADWGIGDDVRMGLE